MRYATCEKVMSNNDAAPHLVEVFGFAVGLARLHGEEEEEEEDDDGGPLEGGAFDLGEDAVAERLSGGLQAVHDGLHAHLAEPAQAQEEEEDDGGPVHRVAGSLGPAAAHGWRKTAIAGQDMSPPLTHRMSRACFALSLSCKYAYVQSNYCVSHGSPCRARPGRGGGRGPAWATSWPGPPSLPSCHCPRSGAGALDGVPKALGGGGGGKFH